jgi:serine/threonine protein kinase
MDYKKKPTSEDVFFDVIDSIKTRFINDTINILHFSTDYYFLKIARYPENMNTYDKAIYQSRYKTEVEVYRIARRKKMTFVPEMYATGIINQEGYIYMYIAIELLRPIKFQNHKYIFPLKSKRHIYRQMELALFELHQNGIIHNDVKFDNYVLTDKNFVKIIDFELATIKNNYVKCPKDYRQYTVYDNTGHTHVITNYMHAVQFRVPLAITNCDSDYYALGCSIAAQERDVYNTILIEGIPLVSTLVYDELEKHTIVTDITLPSNIRELARCITPTLLSYVCMLNYYSEPEILHFASKIYGEDYLHMLTKILEYNRNLLINLIPISDDSRVLNAIFMLKKKATIPEHIAVYIYIKRRENLHYYARDLIFGTPNKDNIETFHSIALLNLTKP